MNKVVIVLSMLMCGNSLFSQSQNDVTEKKLLFGFNLGLNHSNLQANIPLPNNSEISNGTGFRLGLLMDYFINKNLSFSPKAELAFNESKVLITNADKTVTEYNVMPLSMEFMTHFVIKKGDGKLKPYLLTGLNFRMPVSDSKSTTTYGTNADLAIDLGIGIEKTLTCFLIAPEIRYSYGLRNVNNNPVIQSLYYHNVTLAFNFR